ncbi:polysaccharide deacetylase family protein [Leptospira santarosai]|uniref:polysaccharide deacetylase family protein n=1 Tax=Leptospira santarosai TaxID=28183 RepID=UPI0024AF12D6|nr:polysaccharide deacetylase family protein [Leptospira santarosai]MDI7215568.1 polysaccharide deacetylase family protein [Leptospira santarosai]
MAELKILLYHGVTDHESFGIENYSNKHISASTFLDQMQYISKYCTVLSMDDICELYYSGKNYPSNSVAVTFDDGFRNNYTVAAPILDKFNVPATFYITSGIVNTDIMFWVDQLEDCLNLCKKQSIKIKLDEFIIFDLYNYENRKSALTSIKKYCKSVNVKRKDEIIEQVISETEIIPSVLHSKNYEKISWAELKRLSDNPLFTIGGHSMYHDILSSFDSKERLNKDISLSIELLEYNLGIKLIHYAYPEGQPFHYNETIIQLLKDKGIICSPSALHGTNDRMIDMFNLRRIMVGFNGTPFPF